MVTGVRMFQTNSAFRFLLILFVFSLCLIRLFEVAKLPGWPIRSWHDGFWFKRVPNRLVLLLILFAAYRSLFAEHSTARSTSLISFVVLCLHMKANKPKWTQAYAAVYDRDTQSVKLVYWREYLENYLPKDLEARKPKRLPEQTIVYDPKTQGLRLQLWSEYVKVRFMITIIIITKVAGLK